jgi:excisionase family DNA binding protein
MTDERVLVTVAQAAEMLSLSPRQVYDLANAEVFTKRFIGGRNFRLEAEQVRRYAATLPTEAKTA